MYLMNNNDAEEIARINAEARALARKMRLAIKAARARV